MKATKLASVLAAAATLGVAGCASDPYQTAYPGNYPAAGSSTYPPYQQTARYGYVESVETVAAEDQKTGPGIGAIGGAIAGGVLGHQVGSGSGNTAATIGGAVLGGVVGHKVEQSVRNRQAAGVEYRFRVRMDDGSYQTFSKETHDGIQVGDRVRVEQNNIFRS
jgi:outer membrane lipoprotein SlyB